jgi:tetratricopeptide (TPR) repeat protein
MNHLPERTLGLYAIEPALVSAEEGAHLAACHDCQRALAGIRAFDSLLREPETWIGLSDAVPHEAHEGLRAFAVRFAEEDAEALLLLRGFEEPAAAARFVWANLAAKPRYQTGGVARLLCRWANGMCERDPLYALRLAEVATQISFALPETSYPRKAIHELRGEALKEQANALRFLGRLPAALRAVQDSEAEYRKLPHEPIGLAAVKYVRGCVHYEQDELEAAEAAAHDAADAALRLGVADTYMNARHLLGHVLFDRQEYAAAGEVFESILRYGQAKGSVMWIARESLAVGSCYLHLGLAADASPFLHDAVRLFGDIGLSTGVTHAHWAIARLIFSEGNTSEAIYRLRRCIKEFTAYGMLTEAAVVAVDLAEILYTAGHAREIPKVLGNVVRTFVDAGKLTSALTALAYLKDAATAGTMTPVLVDHVRRFVQRAERQPEMLFVPLPPEPL